MVTLDIEDTSIKLMVVKGKQVETAASLPLEPGLVHDGVIINPATVSQRITELMAAHGISEKKVVVSISGIHSIYRVVNVPKLPKNLLDEAAQAGNGKGNAGTPERALYLMAGNIYVRYRDRHVSRRHAAQYG